jgi:hypothetical protein
MILKNILTVLCLTHKLTIQLNIGKIAQQRNKLESLYQNT